jgi:hypothetical protein
MLAFPTINEIQTLARRACPPRLKGRQERFAVPWKRAVVGSLVRLVGIVGGRRATTTRRGGGRGQECHIQTDGIR